MEREDEMPEWVKLVNKILQDRGKWQDEKKGFDRIRIPQREDKKKSAI